MPAPSRPWTTALACVEGLLAALAGLTLLGAALVVVADESDSSDTFDGLGTFLGLLVGGGALVVLLVSGALLALTLRARRTARPGLLRLAGSVPAVIATVWLVGVLWTVVQGAEPGAALLAVVPGAALLVPALGTLRTAAGHPTD